MAPASDTTSRPGLAPERSHSQRLEALNKANEIRAQRKRLKLEIAAGRASFYKLLLDPPEYVETAKVIEFLLKVPKIGEVKAKRLLTQCRISPSKTIGGLSERQRTELADLLRARGA